MNVFVYLYSSSAEIAQTSGSRISEVKSTVPEHSSQERGTLDFVLPPLLPPPPLLLLLSGRNCLLLQCEFEQKKHERVTLTRETRELTQARWLLLRY